MGGNDWRGLEDCIELLSSGRYEVLTRTEDGERFIFPITEPELHLAYNAKREEREISCLDDFDVSFPAKVKEGYLSWRPTDEFILHLRPTNLGPSPDKSAYVGRFSYEPVSKEFLPAKIEVAHNITIRLLGSHRFNEYVRGIYLRENNLILMRAYYNPIDEAGKFNPYKEYDPDLDREMSKLTIDMLVDNGLPKNIKIITRANNKLIKETCLKGLIGYV